MGRSSTAERDGWPIFLKRSDLPTFSGLSMNAILTVLERQGVRPVDVGGKGYGLRWYRDAVMQALGTLHADAQRAPRKRPAKKPTLKIVGKTTAELMEELRKGA